MGKKLAIKGDSTLGKKVIELLEMMGGKNIYYYDCDIMDYSYYVCGGAILCDRLSIEDDDFVIFYREEFWEKYPYKVGDVIKFPNNMAEEIAEMKWDEELEDIIYTSVSGCTRPCHVPKNKEEKKINQMSLANCDLDEVEIVLGDKFELKFEDGKYYAVRKKPTYPINYLACREILGESAYNGFSVFTTLQNLIICRNAYWKIAGEQMGLDKPWEPDLENEELYCIQNYNKQITISRTNTAFNKILIFPTEEMRDVFYEKFKDWIEQCKELL